MRVRLTQIDGKLANLALMRLAAHHKAQGDDVRFSKHITRELDEPAYGRVYASAIFNFSADRVARFRQEFPEAIIGGTWNLADRTTVEDMIGETATTALDYSIYPAFDGSIGFTQRGCRLKCGFCVVPKKEGKNHTVASIAEIYRGEKTAAERERIALWLSEEKKKLQKKLSAKDFAAWMQTVHEPWAAPAWPRHLHLLDNDFFGQPREQWQARVEEIVAGGFKVCLNQGINTRMIDDESAAALKRMGYWDDSFTYRRLYTAWDNIGDEERFFTGIATLERHGIPPTHVMAYMLIGYDKRETWARVLYRFKRMVATGVKPYPMVYGERTRSLPLDGAPPILARRTLAEFQRYAIRRLHTVVPFEDYNPSRPLQPEQSELAF